jgi:hypothetical protein
MEAQNDPLCLAQPEKAWAIIGKQHQAQRQKNTDKHEPLSQSYSPSAHSNVTLPRHIFPAQIRSTPSECSYVCSKEGEGLTVLEVLRVVSL